MEEVLIGGVLVAGVIVWWWTAKGQRRRSVLQRLRSCNAHWGTAFPEREDDLLLADAQYGYCLAFDPAQRKIFLVDGLLDEGELLDYGYLRQWWLAEDGMHLDLSTTDFRRPTLRLPVAGKSQGEAWRQRLDDLLQAA